MNPPTSNSIGSSDEKVNEPTSGDKTFQRSVGFDSDSDGTFYRDLERVPSIMEQTKSIKKRKLDNTIMGFSELAVRKKLRRCRMDSTKKNGVLALAKKTDKPTERAMAKSMLQICGTSMLDPPPALQLAAAVSGQ